MEKVGELWETAAEATFKWKITDFFPISNTTSFNSPKFYFSGTSWEIRIVSNNESKNASEFMGLYLMRMSTGFSVLLDVSFSIETIDNKSYINGTYKHNFDKKNSGSGYPKILSPPFLLKKKSHFNASNDLIVICTLKNSEPNSVTDSLFYRQQDICNNFQNICLKGKKADFRLKIDDKKIPAHRVVLETRSPVFCAMLSHDTKEHQSNEVSVDDVDLQSMHNLLLYMYSGDFDNLSKESVLSIYAAAEKYDIKEIRQICSSFIKKNLSVEWVCDVIEFTELYQDESVRQYCKEYFQENANKILETDNWKTFAKNNQDISVELLATVVKTLFQK